MEQDEEYYQRKTGGSHEKGRRSTPHKLAARRVAHVATVEKTLASSKPLSRVGKELQLSCPI